MRKKNDTYYGEIITQPNVTIIYIKQRSGTFDSRIQTVLARLLPDEYGQVWSKLSFCQTQTELLRQKADGYELL